MIQTPAQVVAPATGQGRAPTKRPTRQDLELPIATVYARLAPWWPRKRFDETFSA